MLKSTNRLEKLAQQFVALLLFISLFAFPSYVFAQTKLQLAEEYRNKGYQEQKKGNLNEALTYYSKAISLGLENEIVFNDLGVLYEEINLMFRAEEYYLQAIAVEPSYLPPYMNLAYLYHNTGFPDQAFEYFKLRYELGNVDDPWTQKAKDELLKIRPEYRKWIVMLEAKRLKDEIVEKEREKFNDLVRRSIEHYNQGVKNFNQQEYRKAIFEYNKALVLAPNNPKIINARKRALLELSKSNVKERSEQALRMLESGDSFSAKQEIRRMLTTIPNEPIIISK